MTEFDIVQYRSQSASEKWDKKGLARNFGRTDLLPFQVADMEFRAPQGVTDSLIERANVGIYGYARMTIACARPMLEDGLERLERAAGGVIVGLMSDGREIAAKQDDGFWLLGTGGKISIPAPPRFSASEHALRAPWRRYRSSQ